jgi:hypothetical protein
MESFIFRFGPGLEGEPMLRPPKKSGLLGSLSVLILVSVLDFLTRLGRALGTGAGAFSNPSPKLGLKLICLCAAGSLMDARDKLGEDAREFIRD